MRKSVFTIILALSTLSVIGQWQSDLGIGVETPKFKLDVDGDINVSAGNNFLIDGKPVSLSEGIWTKNGEDIFRTTGKVGLGLTEPMAKLHIKDSLSSFSFKFNSGHSQFLLGNSGTGYAGLILDASDGDAIGSDYFNIYQDDNLDLRLESMYHAGDIIFMTRLGNGQTDEKESMRIVKGGNVGIGVTEPNEKLEVNGNVLIKDNNALILVSPNGTEFKITVDDNGNLTTSQVSTKKPILLESNVEIYPNPINESLTIEFNNNTNLVNVEIYSLSGAMVLKNSYKSSIININLSGLNSGTYILKVLDENKNIIRTETLIKD